MPESTFAKIIRKTGRKPVSCKCNDCKKQCTVSPCLGTPDDIEKIIDAGYGDKVFPTDWAAGILMRVTEDIVPMFQLEYDVQKGHCVLFENGLCKLHDLGLKPTEGKLSHHSTKVDNFVPKKSLGWAVAKEWLNPDNAETVLRIASKLSKK